MQVRGLGLGALVLASVAAASAAAAGAPRQASIVIDNLTFGPPPAHLRAGDRLRWVNHDLFEHSATADNHAFDVDLPPGKQAEIVLKRPGVYSYFCRFHPGMKGRIVVTR